MMECEQEKMQAGWNTGRKECGQDGMQAGKSAGGIECGWNTMRRKYNGGQR